jgi:PAS domain S-box-containing protein
MISLLYIGNDPHLAGEIALNLQSEPGWCYDTARSAGEGLHRLEVRPYDIIIAEYDLPDVDGFTLLDRIRSSGNPARTILSAGVLPKDVEDRVPTRGIQIWQRDNQPTPTQISALKRSIVQSGRNLHSERSVPEFRPEVPGPILRSPVGHEPAPSGGMHEDPAQNVFYSYSPDGFSILDPEMTILRVNDTVERWFAHSSPLVGKKCYTAYYAKEEPCVVCPCYEAIRTGQTTYAVMPRMGPDASIQGWMDVCSFPITDMRGNPTAVVEYLSDITGREQVGKLVGIERSILTAGPAVVISWKSVPGNAIISITPNVKERFGYDPDDLTRGAFCYRDLIHPDDLPVVQKEIESHRDDGSAFRLKPYRIRNKEGSFRWVMDHVAVFADRDGKTCTYRSYLCDVTESTETEKVLRQNENLFRVAMETGGISVWEYNRVTGQRSCICPVAELFGYRNDEIEALFRRLEEYIHPDDHTALSVAFGEHIADGPPYFACECRIRGKEGAWHWLSIRGSVATRDEHGDPVRIIYTLRDITGMKSDRDAIHAANKKLNLLGSITRHDILNQVMVALGYLALLDELVPPGSEYHEYCHQATEATKRIQRQITFTRDYQNLGLESPEWQHIADIVHHSADACSGIRITVRTDRLEIFADPLLERVFFNLFDNSKRHGVRVTEIVIGFHEEGEHGILTIEDNGIGIPDERKEPIFERGYGRNSGLGLFLAREILDITGLGIREAGIPGTGARFEIVVPGGFYRFTCPAGPANEGTR